MKMAKKLLAVVLTGVMALSMLTGCAIGDAAKAKALEKDLLLLTCGSDHNVVRFIAPLIVTQEEIDFAMAVIDEVMKELV